MKQKKIFILAAAALAFAACSSDESPTAPEEQQTGAAYTQGEVPVAFDAYVNRGTTRAGAHGILNSTALEVGFGVFAYYTDNKPYSETSIPNFMYNQLVYKSGTDWTYTPIKYWPNEFGSNAESDGEDKLTFFAYAPYVEKVDSKTGRLLSTETEKTTGIIGMTSNTTTGDPYIKYAVDFDPDYCVDLCWGVSKDGFSSSVDGSSNTVGATEPFIDVIKPKITDNIKFQFYHALASLNVQIDADVDDVRDGTSDHGEDVNKDTRIWVRSVTFEGITDKGALNLNANGGNTPAWTELSNTNAEIGSGSVTVYDGRRDGKEGSAEASNEKNKINPLLTQGGIYAAYAPATGLKISDAYPGVTKDAVNLFDASTGSDEEKLEMPIYVIPAGEKLSVTIVYDVETYDDKVAGYLSDGKLKGSTVENKISKEVFATGLEAGKKYVVKLHLGMTSVKFEADVTNWDNGDDAEIDLPYNGPQPAPEP